MAETLDLDRALALVRKHINGALDEELLPGQLERCLTEAWFSNTLAWLLDPKGSHKLGTAFGDLFLQRIAINRTRGFLTLNSEEKVACARRKTHLKWGKSGRGISPFGRSLKNATALREFYLTRKVKGKKPSRGGRYCDVVYFDLDTGDSFFVVIEVKLFTNNHSGQLADYVRAVETKFKRVNCREYVYLTLDAQSPGFTNPKAVKFLRRWVPMSWTKDILEVIEKADDRRDRNINLDGLKALLRTLRNLIPSDQRLKEAITVLWKSLVEAVHREMLAELNRLGEGATGEWRDTGYKNTKRSFKLVHSSYPKRPLHVTLRSNMQMVIIGHRPGTEKFEHILIPFGAHPDQVQHLIHIASREIYYRLFDKPEKYLGSARRRTKSRTAQEQEAGQLYHFIWRNRTALMVLASLSGFGTPEELAAGGD